MTHEFTSYGTRLGAARRCFIELLALTLLHGFYGATLSAQAPQPNPAQTPADSPAPGAPATVINSDSGWPRVYTDGKATITVHQPQVESWAEFKLVRARSAVEVVPEKGGEKLLAAVGWEAQSDADLETRTVTLKDVRITSLRIPGKDEATSKMAESIVLDLLPTRRDAVALDRVLAYLESPQSISREVRVSTKAPPIVVSVVPAILVMIDGQPIFGEIPGVKKLKYVINTNWDLIRDGDDGDFYLLNGKQWLIAKTLDGEWKAAGGIPNELKELPVDENWADVRNAVPLNKKNRKSAVPVVHVSYQPAELILINGKARLKPVPGTQLSEVTNTTSLLFYHNGDKNYYFLTAGRWFRNPQLRGLWEFVSDKLPGDFRSFPQQHEKAHVRASIPGTLEAGDAVLLASVPQVAVVNRKEAAAQASVNYIGTPEFKPIEGTSMSYVVNTPADVIKVENKYYLLQQGVWLVSTTPDGPWEVADFIPQEIYTIPPESPKHHTTYVYVTDSDDDSVTTAQTAGYMGLTIGVGYGVAMWGTGYYYPPYYYWGPMYPYPIYWGYPYYSYGAAAWYNPATGFYGRGGVAYGPYGGYGRAAAYNPRTGGYVRRAGAWGPYQGAMGTSFYNPRTGTWGAGYRYANPYQGWGQGVVRRGDQWARGGYYYDERGAIGGIRTSEGGKLIAAGDGENRGLIGRTSDGDLYVGRDGELYRRDESGNWQERGEGGWSDLDRGNLSPEQRQRLDETTSRSAQTRQREAARRNPASPAAPSTADRRAGTAVPRSATGEIPRSAAGRTNRESAGSLDRDARSRSRGSYNYRTYSGRSGGFGGMRRGGRRR